MAIEEHVTISKSNYTKEGLAEKLNQFRSQYNRYPERRDWKEKRITPSKDTFYRIFGNMEMAAKYAEGLWIKERKERHGEQAKRTRAKTPSGFQCRFCGSYIRNAGEYYLTLNKTLAARFIGLLKSHNGQKGQGYFDAVIDCIKTIFGNNNDMVEDVLIKNELSEAFIRLRDSIKESRAACDYCGSKIKKNVRPFFSTFTTILISRFSELLKSKNGTGYLDGVLSSIHAVFGSKNSVMIKALDKEGFLESFLKKFLGEEKMKGNYPFSAR